MNPNFHNGELGVLHRERLVGTSALHCHRSRQRSFVRSGNSLDLAGCGNT